MTACFGVLNAPITHAYAEYVRESLGAARLPLPLGDLLIFNGLTSETLDFIVQVMNQQPAARFILTDGAFNDGLRPQLYDLYARFATDSGGAGEVLVCTQTSLIAASSLRMTTSTQYLPLLVADHRGVPEILDSPLGRLESSLVWYSNRNIDYVDSHAIFEGMTARSESAFWFSDVGFLYLVHQAELIRAYGTASRRIVIYCAADIHSPQFMKLLFTFEAIGIRMHLVFEDDFQAFMQSRDLVDVDIFSRSGNSSLVVSAGRSFFSNEADVAETISTVQSELVEQSYVYQSAKDFLSAYAVLAPPGDAAKWRRVGAAGRALVVEFSRHPPASRSVLLESYVQRWRNVQ